MYISGPKTVFSEKILAMIHPGVFLCPSRQSIIMGGENTEYRERFPQEAPAVMMLM
jgi:hypothetical protein